MDISDNTGPSLWFWKLGREFFFRDTKYGFGSFIFVKSLFLLLLSLPKEPWLFSWFLFIFLVDSGGQYFDGTTDITRTFHYGTPSAEQVRMYVKYKRVRSESVKCENKMSFVQNHKRVDTDVIMTSWISRNLKLPSI